MKIPDVIPNRPGTMGIEVALMAWKGFFFDMTPNMGIKLHFVVGLGGTDGASEISGSI